MSSTQQAREAAANGLHALGWSCSIPSQELLEAIETIGHHVQLALDAERAKLLTQIEELKQALKTIQVEFHSHMATQHGHANDCDCSVCFEINAVSAAIANEQLREALLRATGKWKEEA